MRREVKAERRLWFPSKLKGPIIFQEADGINELLQSALSWGLVAPGEPAGPRRLSPRTIQKLRGLSGGRRVSLIPSWLKPAGLLALPLRGGGCRVLGGWTQPAPLAWEWTMEGETLRATPKGLRLRVTPRVPA